MKNNMNNFPNKWYIEVTEENFELLNRWIDNFNDVIKIKKLQIGCVLLSSAVYYRSSLEDFKKSHIINEHKEITSEEFLYNVFNDGSQLCIDRNIMIKLFKENDCKTWRDCIEKIVFDNSIFNNYIFINNEYIELFEREGTLQQRNLLEKYNIKLPITKRKKYLIEHEKCDIKVGDKVRVARKFEDEENGFPYCFISYMDDFVNSVCEVVCKDERSYTLKFNGEEFVFPYFVLEKVEEQYVEYDFNDDLLGTKVLFNETKSMINFQQKSGVYVGSSHFTYVDLLKNCTHLNGTPFGKLKN